MFSRDFHQIPINRWDFISQKAMWREAGGGIMIVITSSFFLVKHWDGFKDLKKFNFYQFSPDWQDHCFKRRLPCASYMGYNECDDVVVGKLLRQNIHEQTFTKSDF